jgi:hypothetical protein
MTTSAITTALITDEQVSVMMKKVMASLKEKDGNNKKTKRQVHFSVLVIVIVIAIVAMIKNLRTKRIFPTHLHTLFYLIKLGLWKCRCTKCKMLLSIVPKLLSKSFDEQYSTDLCSVGYRHIGNDHIKILFIFEYYLRI